MQKLNLPEANLRLRTQGEVTYVFDVIRKKELVLTPEEWVRQHFIHLLIHHLSYPKAMISLEAGLTYFKSDKRSDLLVYDREGKAFLIIECKAPEERITAKTLNQVSVYNKIVKARYLAVTNGLKHFIWKLEDGVYHTQAQFPEYPVL